jgi:hypothetical protein
VLLDGLNAFGNQRLKPRRTQSKEANGSNGTEFPVGAEKLERPVEVNQIGL